jgi:hypothetical protein
LPVLLYHIPLLFMQLNAAQLAILPFHTSKMGTTNSKFTLYQNQPNPFTQSTAISFMLPRPQKVDLILMDVVGSIISRKGYWLNEGYQEITICDIPIRGVLYYQLRTEDGLLATRRMIAE